MSKILFDKTKYILLITKDDSKMNQALKEVFDTLSSEIPKKGTYVFLRTSVLPDGNPAIFAYDKENSMIATLFTEFSASGVVETVSIYINFWHSNLTKFELGPTIQLWSGKMNELDSKTAKLVSAQAKSVLKRASNLFPDARKVSSYLNSLR